jgi:hypothetical protein
MRYILILSLLIIVSCSSPNFRNEREIKIKNNICFLTDNNDTLKLGVKSLEKDLFQGLNAELFPNIQYDGMQPPQEIGVYDEIQGIYINSKLYDCFKIENGHIKKTDNEFDILFIYPEVSRYNFQYGGTLGYRIFHYLGYLYQEPSSRQNLPYYVQNITKLNSNKLLISYVDNSNYFGEKDKKDTLVFSTFPNLKMEFYYNNLAGFQKSNEYIKLSEDVIKDVNITIPFNTLPQDITELYMREIITHLVNLKFNKKLNTNKIIEKLN